jgi:hypothetical protein
MNLAEALLAFFASAIDLYKQHKNGGITAEEVLASIAASHDALQAQWAAQDKALHDKFDKGQP